MVDMGRLLVEDAADKLRRLLHRVLAAKGMYVRQWGKNLILGRKEPFGPKGGARPVSGESQTGLAESSRDE